MNYSVTPLRTAGLFHRVSVSCLLKPGFYGCEEGEYSIDAPEVMPIGGVILYEDKSGVAPALTVRS